MRHKRINTRVIFIIGMMVLALVVSSDTCASPLYGGYNGQSEAWVEVYIVEAITIGFSLNVSVGIDPDLGASWIRIGISSLFLLPYISNIEFSYETDDIVSASVTGLLPIKVGADSNDLTWIITNWSILVSGADSDDNVWSETGLTGVFGLPGVYANGKDSSDHQWEWIKFFPVLVGWRGAPTSYQGISPSQKSFLGRGEEIRSLYNYFARECGPKLHALLIEKLTDDEFMGDMMDLSETLNAKMARLPLTALSIYENREEFSSVGPSSIVSSELGELLTYGEEEIFTEEIRDELNSFLDTFRRDMQPRLESVKKIIATP